MKKQLKSRASVLVGGGRLLVKSEQVRATVARHLVAASAPIGIGALLCALFVSFSEKKSCPPTGGLSGKKGKLYHVGDVGIVASIVQWNLSPQLPTPSNPPKKAADPGEINTWAGLDKRLPERQTHCHPC